MKSDGFGHYWRGGGYYPEVVETLVLEALKQPVLGVGKIKKFMGNTLYPAKPGIETPLYNKYIHGNGKQYSTKTLSTSCLTCWKSQRPTRNNQTPSLGVQYSAEVVRQAGIGSSDCPPSNRDVGVGTSPKKKKNGHDQSKADRRGCHFFFLFFFFSPPLPPSQCLANRGDDEFLVAQLLSSFIRNRSDFSAASPHPNPRSSESGFCR